MAVADHGYSITRARYSRFVEAGTAPVAGDPYFQSSLVLDAGANPLFTVTDLCSELGTYYYR